MIICVITTTRETWRGPVKHYLGGYNTFETQRVQWLVDWDKALWFAPESVMHHILQRINMITGLEVQLEQIEIIQ